MKTTYPFSRDLVAAVLDRYFSGVAMRGDEVHGESLPTQEQFAAKVAEYLESNRISGIKAKAGEIILARYPSWKQANLQARFTELVDKVQSGGTLTAQEQMEKDSIKSAWVWAKLVRSESDRLESVPGATKDDGNWPA